MMIVLYVVLTFPSSGHDELQACCIERRNDHHDRSHAGGRHHPAAEMKNLFPGTTDQTWAAKRRRGNGPVFIRLGGRRIYYRRADIEKWIEESRYTRTDRPVNA
jgi:hypothetical protein